MISKQFWSAVYSLTYIELLLSLFIHLFSHTVKLQSRSICDFAPFLYAGCTHRLILQACKVTKGDVCSLHVKDRAHALFA